MDRTLLRAAGRKISRPFATALCVALAVLATSLCALPAGQAHAATVPAGMVGMNDWKPPTDQTLGNVGRAGIHRWRAGMFWYMVEKDRGVYNWSQYDRIVVAAARNHVSLLMVLAGCPYWACNGDLTGPPTSTDGLARQREFTRAAVARYGSTGTYWQAHPELPRTPVTEWQVWNEVNSSAFYKPGPDAAAYARLLRNDAAAIRSADPNATVVLSGLTEYGQVPVDEFLRRLYAQPGFKQNFDVMALHAYEPSAQAVGKLLERTRGVMRAAGDGGRPMWLTEMGWGTSSAGLRTPTSEGEQAVKMRKSMDMMLGCRSRFNVRRTYWFSYSDTRPQPGQADNAGNHTGLFDTGGRPKPAWSTLHQYRDGGTLPAGRGSRCTFGGNGPQTRIKSRKRFRSTRRARMRFVASARGARFQCRLIRRVKRRSARSTRSVRRWRKCKRTYRTARLRRGSYRLEVRARDRAGNVDRTPAKARLRLKAHRTTIMVRVLHAEKHPKHKRR